jgi:hypothetical protein
MLRAEKDQVQPRRPFIDAVNQIVRSGHDTMRSQAESRGAAILGGFRVRRDDPR